MKKVLGVYGNPNPHWVGDGFPVRSLFSYDGLGARLSPFLLLDYAGPHYFAPTTDRRGVGEHPHRGFETVTIVYDGEVEHRDSTGAGGVDHFHRYEEDVEKFFRHSPAVVWRGDVAGWRRAGGPGPRIGSKTP